MAFGKRPGVQAGPVCKPAEVTSELPPGERRGSSGRPVLQLTGVRKRHRRRGPWVLDGAALEVAAGDAVQILGTNGSGKSTLLRIAAGLSRASAGSVERAPHTTFVPEKTPMAAPMSTAVYLHHMARIQGVRAPTAIDAAVSATIETHRLEPVASRRIGVLSKGWAQRVAIAQAFVSKPTLVLLDEPWTGVDRGAWTISSRCSTPRACSGTAVVITSHEPMHLAGLTRLQLRGGALVPAARAPGPDPTGSMTRAWTVVLVSRNGATTLDDELAGHPGLREVTVTGDGLRACIGDLDGDALLVAAIVAGWTPRQLRAGEEP